MPAQQTLAQLVRAKHPGAYDDMTDQQLEAAVRAKYPGTYDDIPSTPASLTPRVPAPVPEPSFLDRLLQRSGSAAEAAPTTLADTRGAAKGAASTAIGLGSLVNRYTPVGSLNRLLYGNVPDTTFQTAREQLATPSEEERAGFGLEQAGEYFVPGPAAERAALSIVGRLSAKPAARLLARSVSGAASNAGIAGAQGGDAKTAALIGVGAPVVGATVAATGRAAGRLAPRLVRSALKPTVTAMKAQAGASYTGVDAQAKQLVKFVLDNKITSSAQAEQIIQDAEREVQRLVTSTPALTDAPQRAERYLAALQRSASKQGLPADDVAAIASKARELLDRSPLSEDVISTIMRPSPSGLVGPSGQSVMVPVQQTTRALRTDVKPDEALALARGGSKWSNKKAWGEQKGASTEASKAVERAERDAVKAAVPEARAQLQREGQAIRAKSVFDRMQFRESNREPISPFDVVTAAQGPSGIVLATARHFLWNNKLRMGIWAKRLEEAIARSDAEEASAILGRFGASQTARDSPPASRPGQPASAGVRP